MKILHNARIHTHDAEHPVASAIALQGDHIVALGGDELMVEFDRADCEDMGGQVILPGLTDAHFHLQEYALSLKILDCEVEDKEELLHRVENAVCKVPAGGWLRGHGWDQNTWGGEWPTAEDLDKVSQDKPVYLTAKSLHVSWVNSAALRLAGISPSTQDPINGRIHRNAVGIPTGILLEDAVKLVEAVIPAIPAEALAEEFCQVIPRLWRMGLTGIHDFDKSTCFQALQILNWRGDLRFRVVKSIQLEMLPHAVGLGLRSGFGDDFLRLGSVKLFADGALGPHTAAMFESYVDDSQNRGILQLDNEQLFEYGRQAADGGLSLAVHAIGDRAIHEVLDGFSRLRAYESDHKMPALRHRIEHVQTIHPADARRFEELEIIASMQPSHAPSDMLKADRLLGKRAAFTYAFVTLAQHKARMAFGSDAPVESPNPFIGMHAAVTRCRLDGSPGKEGWFPEQRLSVRQALEGFTLGPAYAAGMEDRLGRLSPGFLADLVVVGTDPYTCDPADLPHIQPTATMVGGDWAWRS